MHSTQFDSYFTTLNTYLELRDLTYNSCKNYVSSIKLYLQWLSSTLNKTPELGTFEDIRSYILYLKKIKKLSNRTINAYISKIRFFQVYVLKRPWDAYEVPFMKFSTTLPDVLSLEDVHFFIDSMVNLKHKACLALLYGSGLRVSELCHLRYEDIDRKSMRIYVRHSKSRSDRYTILSAKALAILTQYWYAFKRPQNWLFPGAKVDAPIVSFTVSRFIEDHRVAIGWSRKVHAHLFRHSFATHFYEQGTDLLTIQKLMGHKSINSTTLYVHLANVSSFKVISPFDNGGV